jgi:serine/threonine protein kinase
MMDSGTIGNLTRPGMIMGTPAYMAPEQAEGAEVSEKTDIYALGIVLYEMLSGTVPFKASTPSAVLIKQLQEAPAPLRKLRREVPSALEQVVMRALEKKPQKRPRDMHEIVQELQQVAATSVVEENPKTMIQTMVFNSGTLERVKLRKAPWFLIGASGAATLLIAGIVAYWMIGMTSQTDDSRKLLSLAIQGEKRELHVGEKTLLRAAAKLTDGSAAASVRNLVWESSNDSVLTVSSKGEAEGRKEGFADVTVSAEGMTSAPFTLIVKTGAALAVEPRPPLSEKIAEQIKTARSSLDQGNYSGALKLLYEAKTLDPKNKNVEAEIQRARRACLAEQRIGLTTSRCD